MTRYYCTYFDRNYLLKGVAMLRSLGEQERQQCIIFAVCMDDLSKSALEKLEIPCVVPVPLSYIEAHDPALQAAKSNRTAVEYLWTCTPSIIRWLMANVPDIDMLTYVDADLFFFSDPSPIFEELGDGSVLIHEHRFPPELRYLEKYGRFNVGLLTFRKDEAAMEVLTWWRERCIEWCSVKEDEGKFGDQAYLDEWPRRFRGIKVLEHPGAGLAPWNHSQYRFGCDASGAPLVNGKAIIFYHFHRFMHLLPEIHVLVDCELYTIPMSLVRMCFRPYLAALLGALTEVRAFMPDFAHGFDPDGILKSVHTFVAHASMCESLRQARLPQREIPLDAEWILFASPQLLDNA